MSTHPTSLLGQEVYFVGAITVPISTAMNAPSATMNWGDVLTVDDEILEAGYDRLRGHWLEHVGDEDEQIARYGDIKFGLGPWPEHWPREDPDNPTLATLASKPYKHHVQSVETRKHASENNSFEVGLRRGF